MITVETTGNGLYTLIESSMSFIDTKKTYWYYDLNKKLLSEKSDFPDTLQTRTLSDDDINYFQQWHLYKADLHKKPLDPKQFTFRPYADKLSNDTLQALEREGAYKHFTLEERQGLNLWRKMYELLKIPYEAKYLMDNDMFFHDVGARGQG